VCLVRVNSTLKVATLEVFSVLDLQIDITSKACYKHSTDSAKDDQHGESIDKHWQLNWKRIADCL